MVVDLKNKHEVVTERFIVIDCKSIRVIPIVGSNPTCFTQTKYNAAW
jgi:hypothetical protein